jgi:hypothetical protein
MTHNNDQLTNNQQRTLTAATASVKIINGSKNAPLQNSKSAFTIQADCRTRTGDLLITNCISARYSLSAFSLCGAKPCKLGVYNH